MIDGYTQPGATPNSLAEGNNAVLRIEIDASNTIASYSRGLLIAASNCEVRGLIINNCLEAGIIVLRSTGNVIAGNWLGVQEDGSTASAGRRNKDGLWISRGANNRIGGTAPADRNLISGNRDGGVVVFGAQSVGNVILGNYVGTDFRGLSAVPNGRGILLFACARNVVGDGTPDSRNVIADNSAHGVHVKGDQAIGNSIRGNRIFGKMAVWGLCWARRATCFPTMQGI